MILHDLIHDVPQSGHLLSIDPGTAILGAGGIAGGASILSGLIGGSGAASAGRKLDNIASLQIQAAERAERRAVRRLEPFTTAGTRAIGSLTDLILGGGDVSDLLQTSPLYNFQLEEGSRAINRQLSGRGLFGSGAGLEILERFTRGLLAEEGERTIGRLFGISQLGQNSAALTANAALQTGQASGAAFSQQGQGQLSADLTATGQFANIPTGVSNAALSSVGLLLQNEQLNNVLAALRPDSVFSIPSTTGAAPFAPQTTPVTGPFSFFAAA